MDFTPNLLSEKNAISSVYPWLIALHIDNSALQTLGYDRVVADSVIFDWTSFSVDVTSSSPGTKTIYTDSNVDISSTFSPGDIINYRSSSEKLELTVVSVATNSIVVSEVIESYTDGTIEKMISFTPFPFILPSINLASSSKFPSLSIQAFNTAIVVKTIEENASTIIGSPLTIYFLNANGVLKANSNEFAYTDSNYPLQFSFVISNIKIGNKITFELGGPNYLTKLIPSKRFYRDFCDAEYKGEYCWMRDRTVVSEENRCYKTWENCVDHWKDQGKPTKGIRYQGFPMLNKGSMVYY